MSFISHMNLCLQFFVGIYATVQEPLREHRFKLRNKVIYKLINIVAGRLCRKMFFIFRERLTVGKIHDDILCTVRAEKVSYSHDGIQIVENRE